VDGAGSIGGGAGVDLRVQRQVVVVVGVQSCTFPVGSRCMEGWKRAMEASCSLPRLGKDMEVWEDRGRGGQRVRGTSCRRFA